MQKAWAPVDAAWAAGLIDGEGCFYSDWGRYNNTPFCFLSVTMTHLATLERLQVLFGGLDPKPTWDTRPNSRPAWCWRLRADELHAALPFLIPHMTTKKQEALLALELLELRKSPDGRRYDGRWNPAPVEISLRKHALAQKLREVKRA